MGGRAGRKKGREGAGRGRKGGRGDGRGNSEREAVRFQIGASEEIPDLRDDHRNLYLTQTCNGTCA